MHYSVDRTPRTHSLAMNLKDTKKLNQKKYRDRFQQFLVEGEHLIEELEKASKIYPSLRDSHLLVTDRYKNWEGPFGKTVIDEAEMAQLSSTCTPPGIVARVPYFSPENPITSSRASIPPPSRSIYLWEVRDPGNLGTILRTLAWFGGFRCLLSPCSVDPYNPKTIRASMGSIFHVPIEIDVPLDQLPHRFKKIACLDLEGEGLEHSSFKDFECYVFGNEARGIPADLLNTMNPSRYTIKGSGCIESLNLATAVTMSIYELQRGQVTGSSV
jgi:TrmH family RNA methyltransferase